MPTLGSVEEHEKMLKRVLQDPEMLRLVNFKNVVPHKKRNKT